MLNALKMRRRRRNPAGFRATQYPNLRPSGPGLNNAR
jgi:hypothetical protein